MKHALHISALVVGIIGAVAAFILLLWWVNDSIDSSDAKWQKGLVYRANHACHGGPPKSFHWHSAGWNNGPYIEVQCPDGTVRIIQ